MKTLIVILSLSVVSISYSAEDCVKTTKNDVYALELTKPFLAYTSEEANVEIRSIDGDKILVSNTFSKSIDLRVYNQKGKELTKAVLPLDNNQNMRAAWSLGENVLIEKISREGSLGSASYKSSLSLLKEDDKLEDFPFPQDEAIQYLTQIGRNKVAAIVKSGEANGVRIISGDSSTKKIELPNGQIRNFTAQNDHEFYYSMGNTVFKYDADTKKETAIYSRPGDRIEKITLLPNGNLLFFTPGERNTNTDVLFLINKDNFAVKNLGVIYGNLLTVSDERIAFNSYVGEPSLMILDHDGNKKAEIATNAKVRGSMGSSFIIEGENNIATHTPVRLLREDGAIEAEIEANYISRLQSLGDKTFDVLVTHNDPNNVHFSTLSVGSKLRTENLLYRSLKCDGKYEQMVPAKSSSSGIGG